MTEDRRDQTRFLSLELKNFLSYKSAKIDFDDFVALVGTNASGKSNVVAAIKLLREIPLHGLPTAIARRGGYDQLRHRSAGHPYDPSIKLVFRVAGAPRASSYEIAFGAVRGKRYEVKREIAMVCDIAGATSTFKSNGKSVAITGGVQRDRDVPVGAGQSAISGVGGMAAILLYEVLLELQTVEVNTANVRELQQHSSVRHFEPDGSNVASVYESLTAAERVDLVEKLATVVPGIKRVDVESVADRVTLTFAQETATGNREFPARQMSDGTLRVFSILLAALQSEKPRMLVVEEPEMAIHLGAMRTLVELLRSQNSKMQVLITTHSADIVDYLPPEALRVVWTDGSSSHVSPLAAHSVEVIKNRLATPGELLRLNALDPA